MQNPIGEADLEWILHRNCEGTEQLRYEKERQETAMSDFDRMLQEAHKQIVECLLKRDVVNGQKALMKHFEMIDNIIHKEL